MTNLLLLVIIVLVSVAFFGDLRRNSAEKHDDFAGGWDRNASPNTQLRGYVRDVRRYGRPAVVRPSRSFPVRKAARDVKRHR
jgi:hypothetical protein